MTTINMKDYVEENANKGNEAAREVMETISTIEPIVGNKNRTPEEKASDIGELKGILKAAIASGKNKVIVSVPVKLLAIDTSYQIPERTERSLKKLIKNWDDVQCMPLIGVPHFEVGYVAVVDGTGRVRASQVIDSKKYEELDVLMVLNVPSEPKDRQLFEAKQYENQNIGNEPLREYQKHGARLIRSDKATLLFSSLKNFPKADVTIPTDKMDEYKKIIALVQKEDLLTFSRFTQSFLSDVLAKKLGRRNKPFDYKSDMKKLMMARQTKEYIYTKNMWDEYLKYLEEKIEKFYKEK